MHYCLQNKSADFRHTQSWLTTSHNNPTRKSAPYGTHSRITILARSFVEVVIQTAIELICKVAILHEKYCAANLQRFSNLAMVQLSLCSIDRLLFGIALDIYILSCATRIVGAVENRNDVRRMGRGFSKNTIWLKGKRMGGNNVPLLRWYIGMRVVCSDFPIYMMCLKILRKRLYRYNYF